MNSSQNTVELNQRWAGILVEELVRCGVEMFCISPGSRSTPLVMAVASHPKARAVVHFDERGAAFFALGYARAAGRPAAWITTSGTAVANGLPAVVEASVDGVPMVLLTADRPPELRQTGANQTIDQPGLFGSYTRWAFDIPPPAEAIDPAFVLTTVNQAVYRATRLPPGPVHLNLMFREPFLSEDRPTSGYTNDRLLGWEGQAKPYTRYAAMQSGLDEAEAAALWERVKVVGRGLLVVGPLRTPDQATGVRRLARQLGWPILPDIASGMRHGSTPAAIFYDLLLADPTFRDAHVPEAVLHLGGRPTSKRLLQFIEESRPAPYIVVQEHPWRYDPSHQCTDRVEASIAAFCQALGQQAEPFPSAPDRDWRTDWFEGSTRIAQRLDLYFQREAALSEPHVARLVTRNAPQDSGLVLASSMPVRDADTFADPKGSAVRIVANRGASGIDGLVATAAGFAEGLQATVTLLIGDLALLHDLNSLAMVRGRPVIIVVLNNDGGGIFHFLPIARHEAFEQYFGTSHGLTFEAAARLFGLDYAHPATSSDFVEVYCSACKRGTATLIEVRTDRRANHTLHQQLSRLGAG